MTRWRRYEEKARGSSFFRGYKIFAQKVSTSTGKRPDYFGISKGNRRQRRIADAKHVKELTPSHVRQVKRYKGYPFFAQGGAIIIKRSTRVPKHVRDLVRESNLRIIRRRARRV
jgi:hypothetical protein